MEASSEMTVPSTGFINRCRRKLSHIDYLSAMKHANRLGDVGLRIYPCTLCSGMHVGHSHRFELMRRRKHAQRKLKDIENRLRSLRLERAKLVVETRAEDALNPLNLLPLRMQGAVATWLIRAGLDLQGIYEAAASTRRNKLLELAVAAKAEEIYVDP